MNGPLVYFRTHLREGMHALYALVAFRQDERAHDLAERCIAAIYELWSAETGWDNETSRDDQNPGYLDRGEINNTRDIVETARSCTGTAGQSISRRRNGSFALTCSRRS